VSSQPDRDDPALIRLWFCAGLVFGLLLALAFAWRWTDAGSGTRIQVLGSGKYVSVLITHEQRRVLFAAGSNGSAFSNAISAALPPIGDEIDVLLIDPRSSADVIDRARSLGAKQTRVMPDPATDDGAEIARRSFVIDLGGDVAIAVRIEPNRSWTAVVTTSAGLVSITPGASSTFEPVWISLNGKVTEVSSDQQIRIGPTANGLTRSATVAAVSAGSVLTIRVDESAFRIPQSSFAIASSGERADHLAGLDRELLLKLGPDRRPQFLVAQDVQAGQRHGLSDPDRVLVAHL